VAHEAITTNTTGTTVDGAAASAGGAIANLHVTAGSGTSPTLDVIVEHSTKNSTWATLGTFAQATGTGAQSLAIAGTEIPLTVSPEGIAVNSAAAVAKGYVSNFAPSTAVGDRVNASLTFTVNGRAVMDGRNLVAHEAITTNTTGTTVDGAAASAGGAIANLHVTAVSGTSPTLDVIVEHSTNNSTWGTLGTFAQATGTGAESIAVAGAVYRYVRASATLAGTNPSFTIAVAVGRL